MVGYHSKQNTQSPPPSGFGPVMHGSGHSGGEILGGAICLEMTFRSFSDPPNALTEHPTDDRCKKQNQMEGEATF